MKHVASCRLFILGACCSAAIAGEKLDSLHLDGLRICDSFNRMMVLRGVVTITGNNDGRPMVMTPADYERIRAWGFNVQQIRLEAHRLGLLPPCKAEPDYLDKLESWVNMAEAQGIYTIFKATTYDVPGLGFKDQFKPGAWDKLWNVNTGWQDQFIAGWRPVWERFKNRPSVIGYDFLNECSPGSDTRGFYHNYLVPFYRRGCAALRQIDRQHFFIFQPSLRSDDKLEPLGSDNVVFAPHFYAKMRDPETFYRDLLATGERIKAPVIIGEYGLPNIPFPLGKNPIPASTPERDEADATLFDATAMNTIKTWYTNIGNWSLLQPDGSEIPRFRFFSRPYPQRTAGVPGAFSFNFRSHEWNFRWETDTTINVPTVIFVPLKRHYPNGFRLTIADTVQLETDCNKSLGLRVIANPKNADISAIRYDFASEILTLGTGKKGGSRTLKITPRSLSAAPPPSFEMLKTLR